MKRYLLILFFLVSYASAEEWNFDECCANTLMKDLMIVQYWDCKLNEKFPTYYNLLLQGGYWNMPTARMGAEGEVGFGYSSVPPYRNWNARFQLTPRIEVSADYRIFKGVDDPILTPLGFGDMSDKGANIKFAIIRPEDSDYRLPGIAIGLEDFLGTRSFKARYIVATQVFKDYNFEISLGYGQQRIRGLYGGICWMPFLQTCHALKPLAITAEYDAIPYKNESLEPHPKGRNQTTRMNWGLKYRLWDHYDFSIARIRGTEWAASVSAFYNFGNMKSLMPKTGDKKPYRSPVNRHPIGEVRPSLSMTQELAYAFKDQGFKLLDARMGKCACYGEFLEIKIVNKRYRLEEIVRHRVTQVLACLIPKNIDTVFVTIDGEGFPVQQYRFPMKFVRLYGSKKMGPYELQILSPLCEVNRKLKKHSKQIFRQRRDLVNFEILPNTRTLFGSSKGKFKYAAGLRVNFNGYLWNDLFYYLSLGWTPFTDFEKFSGIDRLNPSQIINVHTDVVRYYQAPGIHIPQFYLQKNWSLGRSWYSRVALGYFEEEYGGIASEVLYYPLKSDFAFGVEGAILPKRTILGLGFTNKVRKLKGFTVTHRHFVGTQYFVSLYYDWKSTRLDFHIKAGKFLANDYGIRYEVGRYYPSGMRAYFWYTRTNAKDYINGQRYFDKGIGISMPFDLFYSCSERSRWNYGMSAWLRDVGYSVTTGKPLYLMISDLRQNRCHSSCR